MKTKILMTVLLTGVLSSSVFAANGMNSYCDSMPKKMNSEKMGKYHSKMKSPFFAALKNLNLTADQKNKIFEIRKEMMKNKQTTNVAFSKTSFDKEKYIEIMKQKRDNMIESKGQMIENIYAILTKEQKEQLKVMMDLKAEKRMAMMDKRMNFDKNCNGRR